MKTAHEIVNNSGYPLQIRLEEWIKETYQQHNWKTLAREHRWVNQETKDDGYIDLILEKNGINIRLVIECKRIDGSWTFLTPGQKSETGKKMMALKANYVPTSYIWKELPFLPNSFESSFCVMEIEGKKDNRTLEKLTGELLLSLEHLAIEETELFISVSSSDIYQNMFYYPVIVTTATLQTMNFSPSAVDVKTGKIIINESSLSPVEYIRFRKNLPTTIKNGGKHIYSLTDINLNNDRTVLVVQAESFIDFLQRIDT